MIKRESVEQISEAKVGWLIGVYGIMYREAKRSLD